MARRILLEEFHFTATVPRTMTDREREVIRRMLNGWKFRVQLRNAIFDCLRKFPALARARLTISV